MTTRVLPGQYVVLLGRWEPSVSQLNQSRIQFLFFDSNKNYLNKVSQNLNIIGLNKPTELKIKMLLLPVTVFYSISHESQMQGRQYRHIYFFVMKYNENMRMVKFLVHNNNMTLQTSVPRDAMKIKIT